MVSGRCRNDSSCQWDRSHTAEGKVWGSLGIHEDGIKGPTVRRSRGALGVCEGQDSLPVSSPGHNGDVRRYRECCPPIPHPRPKPFNLGSDHAADLHCKTALNLSDPGYKPCTGPRAFPELSQLIPRILRLTITIIFDL